MTNTNGKEGTVEQVEEKKPVCGIVMPISAIDGCAESHWLDVRAILLESIGTAGFVGNLVSDADEVTVIQKTIIQNLYDNPIVVCDVSGRNPNVMFELGMRLAFDKPTIIVKDDATNYAFDTSVIEHLAYPRDLRYATIRAFKKRLADKVRNTHERATKVPDYTTFLKNFGEFKIAKIDQKEVSTQEYVVEQLKNIQLSLSALRQVPRSGRPASPLLGDGAEIIEYCVAAEDHMEADDFAKGLFFYFPKSFSQILRADNHYHVTWRLPPGLKSKAAHKELMKTHLAKLVLPNCRMIQVEKGDETG